MATENRMELDMNPNIDHTQELGPEVAEYMTQDTFNTLVVGGILVPCINRLYRLVLTLQTYNAHYDMESCNQGAFLIGIPEVLQSLL